MFQAEKRKTVFLIGSQNKNVDKYYHWNFDYMPNIFEPDIILIDLTTLTDEILKNNKHRYDILGEAILNKILNQGVIIVITHPKIQSSSSMFNNTDAEFYSNYFFSPVTLATNIVDEGKLIIPDNFI